jgi:hypothetical protein
MIEDFKDLFRRKREESMQERAEESRRIKNLERRVEEKTDNLERLLEELTKNGVGNGRL